MSREEEGYQEVPWRYLC